jgi:hypothetical protein
MGISQHRRIHPPRRGIKQIRIGSQAAAILKAIRVIMMMMRMMMMMKLLKMVGYFEKDEAVKAVKCERNKQNIFRLARAYHKLRQWKKLENITSTTVLDEIFPIVSNKSSDDDGNSNSDTNIHSSKFYKK